MSSVESRIVTMKFDNVAFERGVATTLTTLGRLKTSLDLSGAAGNATSSLGSIEAALSKIGTTNPLANAVTGVGDLQTATSNVSMGAIEGGISSISAGFIAMSTVAITALATITSAALRTGADVASSLTFDPMKQGFEEYELKLGSIQAILSNTDGASLKDVNTALQQLNEYSDKTIYNFGEMVSNIKTFTVAGIDLKTSVSSVKGLANVAALTGTNASDAARATYQMAQAMSSGSVRLQDWMSLEHAGGMAGKVFQESLKRTASAHGINVEQMIKDNGSFRLSLSEGWLSADILNETLGQFSGIYSKAQLAAQGYTDSQIKDIIKLQKTAQKAAQDVKTFSAFTNTFKETIGSGWAETWETVFGNLEDSTKLWTGVNNELGGMVTASSDARNKVLKDWAKGGGRDILLESLANAWKALLHIIMPIKRAFREVFPAKTGKDLIELTKSFRDFTEGLIANKQVMSTIREIFTTVFNVLSIGIDIVQGLWGFSMGLIGALSQGSGGAMKFVKSVYQVINSFLEWLRSGEKIRVFLTALGENAGKVLAPVFGLIGKALAFFGGFAGIITSAGGSFKKFGDILLPIIEAIWSAFSKVADIVKGEFLSAFKDVTPSVEGIKDAIIEALSNLGGMGNVFAGIFDGIGNPLADVFSIGTATDAAKGGIEGVSAALSSLSGGSAQEAQTELSGFAGFLQDVGDKLLNFAQAIGSGLATFWGYTTSGFSAFGGDVGGIWAGISNFFGTLKSKMLGYFGDLGFDEGLALVNTAFFISLYMMMRSFVKKWGGLVDTVTKTFEGFNAVTKQVTSNLKTMQTDIRSDIILKIAGALALLTASLWVLSKLDQKELALGLASIAGLLTMMVGALITLEKTSKFGGAVNISLISVALVGLAAGLVLMAGALAILGLLDPKQLQQGLIAMAEVIGGLVVATALLGVTGGGAAMVGAAVALVILSAALVAMAAAIKLYSGIDADTLINGGIKIALILVGLGVAMMLFPPTALLTAASLFIVAAALIELSVALRIMAKIGWEDLQQSVKALIILLGAIAVSMLLMTGTAAGAGAFMLVIAALWLLVPLLVALGELGWEKLLMGLAGLAGVFLVIGAAALILSLIIVPLLAVGAALVILGAGLAMVGAGMLWFATGLALLGTAGAAGLAVLTAVIIGIAELIPLIAQQVGLGIVAIAKVISEAGPQLMEAMAVLLASLLQAIIDILPKLGETIRLLLKEIFQILRDAVPDMIETTLILITALLTSLRNHIPEMTRVAGQMIVKFLNGITKAIPKIAKAGRRLIVAFLNGITHNMSEVGDAVGDVITKFIEVAGQQAKRIIKAGFHLLTQLMEGMGNGYIKILNTVTDIVIDIGRAFEHNLLRLIRTGFHLIVHFLNGVADAIENNSEPIYKAFWRVGAAIMQGMVDGLGYFKDQLWQLMLEIATDVWEGVKDFFHVGSPSKQFHWLGTMLNQGFADGIRHTAHKAPVETEKMGKGVLDTMKKTMKDVHNLGDMDAQPRITPVLDITKFQRDASKMGPMIDRMKAIRAEVSARRADGISADHLAAREQKMKAKEQFRNRDKEINFVQNNNSPKSLSHIEIYRQTRNQLSLAKEALKV